MSLCLLLQETVLAWDIKEVMQMLKGSKMTSNPRKEEKFKKPAVKIISKPELRTISHLLLQETVPG
ncbi:hypothetical protein F2Q70_00040640 [Brassica cretica]|uniref:Uncharacterized protein n=1 Tax=Brassica cretica TaxID=69181 RepID=A0A8S9K148_BRACR|nr:hypothetical protein F2Q70_00040640 [Brassica cretica]